MPHDGRMRENRIESIWIGVTIVYGLIVGFSFGGAWSDAFTIVGASVVGLGWAVIGRRRYVMRRHFERRESGRGAGDVTRE